MDGCGLAPVCQIWRVVAVLALLVAAGALATEPGKLPLALRGLQKMLGRKESPSGATSQRRMAKRRFLAFILVVLAAILACL